MINTQLKNHKQWVSQPNIRTFFWDRNPFDRMAGHSLESDDYLLDWCDEHNCEVKGTWVECPDDETVVLFALRWV